MRRDGTSKSDWELLKELNAEEVKRQIPLMIYLLLVCLVGIPGNSLVCYIYRTEYKVSSSRWFIFFLGAVDIILCIVILPCEVSTLFQQYIFTDAIWCKFSAFCNLVMLISLGLTLLAVSVDRYRKVCKPLGWQINFRKGRIICAVCIFAAFLIASPVFAVYDIYEIPIENFTVTARECSFRKSMEKSLLPFYYVAFGLVVFAGALITICVLYCVIGRSIKMHIKREKIKRHISLSASMARKTDHIRPICTRDTDNLSRSVRFNEPGSPLPKRAVNFGNLPSRKKAVNFTTNSASVNITQLPSKLDAPSSKCSTHSPSISVSQEDSMESSSSHPNTLQVPSASMDSLDNLPSTDEFTEDYQSNTSHTMDEDFHKPKLPLTSLQKTKSKRIRRARARKATFSMFLISITFVLSYLPFLSLLLVRSMVDGFDESMSDAGRATYKFFLRSGYVNCAINPFIYGISDSSFREKCKSVLSALFGRLRNINQLRIN